FALMEKQAEGFRKAARLAMERIEARDKGDMRSWVSIVQEQFIDRFHSILKLRGKVAENLNVNIEDLPIDYDPRFLVDELSYANSPALEVAVAVRQDVEAKLRSLGISEQDFGLYLMNRRIAAGDRQAFANPHGTTPAAAKMVMGALGERLGQARFREMEKLGDKFNEIIFGAVEKAYKSGTISEDV